MRFYADYLFVVSFMIGSIRNESLAVSSELDCTVEFSGSYEAGNLLRSEVIQQTAGKKITYQKITKLSKINLLTRIGESAHSNSEQKNSGEPKSSFPPS
tara:strand:- start:710 stop:1006 length:297 start_codon:yes stop_codon:yes gene_type:complete